MSKALVIKGVSFEENALDKVMIFNDKLVFHKGYSALLTIGGGINKETATLSANSKQIIVVKDNGKYPISYNTLNVDADNSYPIPIPTGSNKVKITAPSLGILYTLYNKDLTGTKVTSGRTHSKAVDGIISSGGTQWSISEWTYDYMEIDLSTKENSVNSITLSLYNDNESVIANYDTSKIKIEFE